MLPFLVWFLPINFFTCEDCLQTASEENGIRIDAKVRDETSRQEINDRVNELL